MRAPHLLIRIDDIAGHHQLDRSFIGPKNFIGAGHSDESSALAFGARHDLILDLNLATHLVQRWRLAIRCAETFGLRFGCGKWLSTLLAEQSHGTTSHDGAERLRRRRFVARTFQVQRNRRCAALRRH